MNCWTANCFRALLRGACVLDEWRLEYNHRRPHSGIDWQTPPPAGPRTTRFTFVWPTLRESNRTWRPLPRGRFHRAAARDGLLQRAAPEGVGHFRLRWSLRRRRRYRQIDLSSWTRKRSNLAEPPVTCRLSFLDSSGPKKMGT